MPSSRNYVRNYTQERLTEKPKRKRERALRNKARRALERRLGRPIPGTKDVDHIKPLDKGGAPLQMSNLRETSRKANRSFPRNSKGGVK